MKNLQKGFIVPALLVIVALLVVGGGVYIYENKKTKTPSILDTETRQSDQVKQQTNNRTQSEIQPPSDTTNIPTTNTQQKIASTVVLSPNGGEVWQAGNLVLISFNPRGELGKLLTVDLVNLDTKQEWTLGNVVAQAVNEQQISGALPNEIPSGNHYKVRVSSCSATECNQQDLSDSFFTVLATERNFIEPSLIVLRPVKGEILRVGSEFKIRWRTNDFKIKTSPVSLELRDKYGWVVQTIASQAPNTGSYTWAIPPDVSKTSETNNGGPFTIFAVSDDEDGSRASDYSEHFTISK